MSDSIPKNLQIFAEQYPQFMKLQRQLAKADWYVQDGWVLFIGLMYSGIFFQLYKTHWHNYTLDGIHFEAGMDEASLENKTLQIDLHIGHRNLFDRERFNELTIDSMAEVVDSWNNADIRFSKKNLSERLSVPVKFSQSGFPKQISNALTPLCLELAPIIDEGLLKLKD